MQYVKIKPPETQRKQRRTDNEIPQPSFLIEIFSNKKLVRFKIT